MFVLYKSPSSSESFLYLTLNYSESAQNRCAHILGGDEFRLVHLINPNKSGN